MAELEFERTDAFTTASYTGNPTGIVFDADVLDETQMQRIANEMGASVTGFLMRSKKADLRIRFFSPLAEEPLSGHGTIAALWSLVESQGTGIGSRRRLETQAGVLPFSVEGTAEGPSRIWMTQKRPLFSKEGDEKEIASALGVGAEGLFHDQFPLSRASTGIPYLLVAVRSIDILGRIEPRRDELVALCKELDVAGIQVFTWSVLEPGSTVHARCFVASPGQLENPASGMAAGALGAYMVEHEYIPRETFEKVVIEQGHFAGRPAHIDVRVEKRQSTIRKVEVGGAARVTFRGRLQSP